MCHVHSRVSGCAEEYSAWLAANYNAPVVWRLQVSCGVSPFALAPLESLLYFSTGIVLV